MTVVEAMTLDAELLKTLRAQAGLTQQELATRAGLSIALVVSLEQGRRNNPRLDTLRKLAKGLGCTAGQLIGDEPPPRRRGGKGG
jgi:transcriptional regulator with XRE-family HTH domain